MKKNVRCVYVKFALFLLYSFFFVSQPSLQVCFVPFFSLPVQVSPLECSVSELIVFVSSFVVIHPASSLQVMKFEGSGALRFHFHSDGSNVEWGYKFKVGPGLAPGCASFSPLSRSLLFFCFFLLLYFSYGFETICAVGQLK